MSLGPSCIAETQACNDSTLAFLIPEPPDLHPLDLDMLTRENAWPCSPSLATDQAFDRNPNFRKLFTDRDRSRPERVNEFTSIFYHQDFITQFPNFAGLPNITVFFRSSSSRWSFRDEPRPGHDPDPTSHPDRPAFKLQPTDGQ